MFSASNNYRFNGINVTNSSFSWSAMDGTRQSQCRVNINRGGTFEINKDCACRLSGKFEGKKAAIGLAKLSGGSRAISTDFAKSVCEKVFNRK